MVNHTGAINFFRRYGGSAPMPKVPMVGVMGDPPPSHKKSLAPCVVFVGNVCECTTPRRTFLGCLSAAEAGGDVV